MGGALHISGACASLVHGSTISGNSAQMYGGAIAALAECPLAARQRWSTVSRRAGRLQAEVQTLDMRPSLNLDE
jgi:predicted outer membrane repeat protein